MLLKPTVMSTVAFLAAHYPGGGCNCTPKYPSAATLDTAVGHSHRA